LLATARPFVVVLVFGVPLALVELLPQVSSWKGFNESQWRLFVAALLMVSVLAAFHKVRLERDALRPRSDNAELRRQLLEELRNRGEAAIERFEEREKNTTEAEAKGVTPSRGQSWDDWHRRNAFELETWLKDEQQFLVTHFGFGAPRSFGQTITHGSPYLHMPPFVAERNRQAWEGVAYSIFAIDHRLDYDDRKSKGLTQ
jgi:hypothetical protein